MPGDLKSIGLLDVQFGAMDLISDNMPFESADAKFNATNSAKMEAANAGQATPSSNMDLNSSSQNSTMDAYSTQQQKTNAQSSISPALSQSVRFFFFLLLKIGLSIFCFPTLRAVE